jgi:hypothetical protein
MIAAATSTIAAAPVLAGARETASIRPLALPAGRPLTAGFVFLQRFALIPAERRASNENPVYARK